MIDRYIARGITANRCAIDLSKAFDKVNHHALIKLMNRQIPAKLLDMIEHLYFTKTDSTIYTR